MECNVGGIDRNIRLAAGVALLSLAVFGRVRQGARIATLLLGAANLFSGASRFCPVNRLLGVNSCQPNIRKAVEEAVDTATHLAA